MTEYEGKNGYKDDELVDALGDCLKD
jgi:hypothetical protein